MKKHYLATIKIKDIARYRHSNQKKILYLIFDKKYLIELYRKRLREFSEITNFELGILLDNGCLFYLNVHQIRWNEIYTRCQLIIKFRSEDEKKRLIRLYQIEASKRQEIEQQVIYHHVITQ